MTLRDNTPLPLSIELLAYRDMARTHAPDPETGQCRICKVQWCTDRRFSLAQLICAAQSVADL